LNFKIYHKILEVYLFPQLEGKLENLIETDVIMVEGNYNKKVTNSGDFV